MHVRDAVVTLKVERRYHRWAFWVYAVARVLKWRWLAAFAGRRMVEIRVSAPRIKNPVWRKLLFVPNEDFSPKAKGFAT